MKPKLERLQGAAIIIRTAHQNVPRVGERCQPRWLPQAHPRIPATLALVLNIRLSRIGLKHIIIITQSRMPSASTEVMVNCNTHNTASTKTGFYLSRSLHADVYKM